MKTIIVVIPIGYSNARKVCNMIENTIFETYTDLRNVLNSELNVNEDDDNQPQFFTLSDFIEEVNDELFYAEGNFISYINLKQ